MQTDTTDTSAQPSRQTWRPLRLFNLYRLVIAGLFVVFAFSELSVENIGHYSPSLFKWVAVLYLLIGLLNTLNIKLRKPDFSIQVHSQVIIDIIVITLFMVASGGVQSGLGMLLIVAVASGSLLLAGRAAMFFAAIAALLVLGQQTYLQITDLRISTAYPQTGLLGAAFFATAMLAFALARRIRESEALAAKRGVDLANMEQLTQYVIQQMQTGVAIIDTQTRLWQINESARQLLNIDDDTKDRPPLATLCPELAEQHQLWQIDPDATTNRFQPGNSDTELLPHFAKLGEDSGTLIFLEDMAAMRQQAQQLKLASLGRLAGSIAHEIRNPLGAISHANQLLGESENLDKHDLRLYEIIRSNSQRMNSIIENILQLGRRDQAVPESITLKPWLETFADEFYRNQNIPAEAITLQLDTDDLSTEFDASQLHQVMWNLCHNGLRHSKAHTGTAKLTIKIAQKPDSPIPYIDVIDVGPGVAADIVDHLFEPFVTTASNGTGLGLYIAKELCECNHALLNYFPTDAGSCFRITFADPRRRRTH